MARKLLLIGGLILIASAGVTLFLTRSAQGLSFDPSGEEQSVRETIQRARRIQLEAQYTFDTSQYSTCGRCATAGSPAPPPASRDQAGRAQPRRQETPPGAQGPAKQASE